MFEDDDVVVVAVSIGTSSFGEFDVFFLVDAEEGASFFADDADEELAVGFVILMDDELGFFLAQEEDDSELTLDDFLVVRTTFTFLLC